MGFEFFSLKCLQKVSHRPAEPAPLNASETKTFDHKEAAAVETVRQDLTIVIRYSGSDVELVAFLT